MPTRDALRRKACIVGVYTTDQGDLPHRTTLDLMMESIKGVLEDCGLKKEEIDGLAGNWGGAENPLHCLLATQLHTPIRWYDPMVGDIRAVNHAAAAVATGLANVVLIVAANSRSVRGGITEGGPNEFSTWVGASNPGWHALYARLHMHNYGTTSEQLAEVAVAFRKHASLNPQAWSYNMGTITVEDVINSRMICDPLHLLDCSRLTDGAYAMVITSPERARGLKKKPAYVLGAAEQVECTEYLDIPEESWLRGGATYTGRRAMEMAGVTPNDVDVFETYDAYTITVIRQLEDLGFCKPGEGGPFVAGGTLQLGGKLPTNTNGGLLSHSHMGSPGGLCAIEGVRQLRGECGAHQVPNCQIALCHNQSGAQVSHTTVVLGRP